MGKGENEIFQATLTFDAFDESEGRELLVRRLKEKLAEEGLNTEAQSKLALVGIYASRDRIRQVLEYGALRGMTSTCGFTFETIEPDTKQMTPFMYANAEEGAILVYDVEMLWQNKFDIFLDQYRPSEGKTFRDALLGIITVNYTNANPSPSPEETKQECNRFQNSQLEQER